MAESFKILAIEAVQSIISFNPCKTLFILDNICALFKNIKPITGCVFPKTGIILLCSCRRKKGNKNNYGLYIFYQQATFVFNDRVKEGEGMRVENLNFWCKY